MQQPVVEVCPDAWRTWAVRSGARLRGRSQLACAIFALIWGPVCIEAQYVVDHWTTERGLPANGIRAVHQTRDGYLWVATIDGLARFDGVRFTTFDRSNTPGIESNRFLTLYESASGDLWLGSESGVTRYHEGVFTSYTTNDGLPRPMVNGISGDETGNIWVLAEGAIMRWQRGRFVPIGAQPEGVKFTPSEWDVQTFFGVDNKRIYCFKSGEMKVTQLPKELRGLYDGRLAEEPFGRLWVVLRNARLAVVQGGRVVKIYSMPISPPPGTAPGGAAPRIWYRDNQGGCGLSSLIGSFTVS
jgi:hypothetical protein